MSGISIKGRQISNVFQLIGTLENDITKSIAWALNQCPAFSKLLFDEMFMIDCDPCKIQIVYQSWENKKGITDLEITDNELFYVIIEAKRGWLLPEENQLKQYSERVGINGSKVKHKAIVSMSECSEYYADAYLPFKSVNGFPIKHLSWRKMIDVASSAVIATHKHAQKRLLSELKEYLGGVMETMQSKTSNSVFVVSLSYKKVENSDYSYVDVVEKLEKYFHPFGIKRWPKEPSNYIAFRYDGKLQSIHHIESYVITKKLQDAIPEMPEIKFDSNHIVYTLGPAIRPNKIVKTGNLYSNGRVRAMLDLLLTSDTIAEAVELSKRRLQVES